MKGFFSFSSWAIRLATFGLFSFAAITASVVHAQSPKCETYLKDFTDNKKQLDLAAVRTGALNESVSLMESSRASGAEIKDELEAIDKRIQATARKINDGDSSIETANYMRALYDATALLKRRIAGDFNAKTFYGQPLYRELEKRISSLKAQELDLKAKDAGYRGKLKENGCPNPPMDDPTGDIGDSADLEDAVPAPKTSVEANLAGTWQASVPSADCTVVITMVLRSVGADTWTGPVTQGGDCRGGVSGPMGNVTLINKGGGALGGDLSGTPFGARISGPNIVLPVFSAEITFVKK